MPRDIHLMKIGERRSRPTLPPGMAPVPAPLPASLPGRAPTSFPKLRGVPFPTPGAVPPRRSGPGFIRLILALIMVCAGIYGTIHLLRQADDSSRLRLLEEKLNNTQREINRLQRDFERSHKDLQELKARGGVTAATLPAGATLAVAGVRSVKSPGTIADVRAGKRLLWITLEGYETVEMEVQVAFNQTLDLGTIELSPRTGRLNLICEMADAGFFIRKTGSNDPPDSPSLKILASARDLLPGKYELTAKIAGKEAKKRMDILPNMTTQVTCSFKVESGINLDFSSELTRSQFQEERDLNTASFRIAKADDPPWKLTSAESRLILQAKADFDSRKFEEAILCYQQVLKTKPKCISALAGLGALRLAEKRHEEAEALFRRALSVDEGDAFSLEMLGLIFYKQRRYEEARACFDQSLARINCFLSPKPDGAFCHHYLGAISQGKGELAAAEQSFLQAVAINPNYADAHLSLALYYSAQPSSSKELARKHYATALDLGVARNPTLEEILNR